MRIESTAVSRGPNIYALLPLIHLRVNLWKQIIYFKPAEALTREHRDRQEDIDLSSPGLGVVELEGLEIIRDERGVRLLREPGSER